MSAKKKKESKSKAIHTEEEGEEVRPSSSSSNSKNAVSPSLNSLGYHFNPKGVLCSVTNNEKFKFEISPDLKTNKAHYEAVAEAVIEEVYDMLERRCGLIRAPIPVIRGKGPSCFVFHSPDFFENKSKLLVLIHGSGAVHAGIWSRRLLINEDLDQGSMIPYIEKGIQLGYSILILNGNASSHLGVFGNETPEAHASYVWENYVIRSPAKHFAIVAHSYGGEVTFSLAEAKKSRFLERVSGVAFTDSAHDSSRKLTKDLADFFHSFAFNWISSDDPLNSPQPGTRPLVPRVSSGHHQHENTSHAAFPAVFPFLDKCISIQDYEKLKTEKPHIVNGPSSSSSTSRQNPGKRK